MITAVLKFLVPPSMQDVYEECLNELRFEYHYRRLRKGRTHKAWVTVWYVWHLLQVVLESIAYGLLAPVRSWRGTSRDITASLDDRACGRIVIAIAARALGLQFVDSHGRTHRESVGATFSPELANTSLIVLLERKTRWRTLWISRPLGVIRVPGPGEEVTVDVAADSKGRLVLKTDSSSRGSVVRGPGYPLSGSKFAYVWFRLKTHAFIARAHWHAWFERIERALA